MNSIDSQDRMQIIFRYGKYIFIILIVLGIFLMIKSCNRTYSNVEEDVIEAAKKYIVENKISISSEKYIELTKLDEIEGTELCSKASGVIVTNKSGSLNYEVYLECGDYKSRIIENKNKYISLIGGDTVILNKGELFDDPLYILNKEADVVISGTVGTEIGIYTKSYTVYIDNKIVETLYRKIIVTNNDKDSNISGLVNEIEPTLTLLGDKNIVLGLGEIYKEPGYRAVDYVDGKISRAVKVSGKVDTNVLGIHTITYSIANSKGNIAVAVRTINVVKRKSDLKITTKIDNENIAKSTNISLSVNGSNYSYTKMPNGEENMFTNLSYKATENKIYVFKVYDTYNNEYIKEVEVTNIDNIPPTGVCNATTNSTKTDVEVTASDNKGIAGYSYTIDAVSTEFKNEKTYSIPSKSTNVSVNVKDIVGNTTKISCKLTVIKDPVISDDNNDPVDELPNDPNAQLTKERFNNSNGDYMRYFLYVPSSAEISNVPLIVYLHGDGEKGDNLDDTSSVSIPKYLKRGTDFNAIIIAPQIKTGKNWYDESIEAQLKELIDYIVSNYNVDSNKIILTGHSSGAIGTWHMAARYQNYFSCMVPLSYGDTNRRPTTSLADSLTNIPIRGYVGETDASRERMQQLVDAINASGGNAELIILKGKGHIIQDAVYLKTDIFDWMYDQ